MTELSEGPKMYYHFILWFKSNILHGEAGKKWPLFMEVIILFFFFFIDLKDSRGRLNDKTVKSTSVFIIAIT